MQTSARTLVSLPSKCVIYLAPVHNQAIKGLIYSSYYKKSFPFHNDWELLSGMDGLFDNLSFPQATFAARTFLDKKAKKVIRRVEDSVDDNMDDMLQNEKTTFIVNVQYRQNATWQGTITWVEQNRTQHFRSAFEMLKLMEQANQHGVTEVVHWDDPEE